MFHADKSTNLKLEQLDSSYRFTHSSRNLTCHIVDNVTKQVWCEKQFDPGTTEEDALKATMEEARTRTKPKSPAELAIERASSLEQLSEKQRLRIAELESQLADAKAQDKLAKPSGARGRRPRGQKQVVEDPVSPAAADAEDDDES